MMKNYHKLTKQEVVDLSEDTLVSLTIEGTGYSFSRIKALIADSENLLDAKKFLVNDKPLVPSEMMLSIDSYNDTWYVEVENETFHESKTVYMVIEILEREVCSVWSYDKREKAVDKANELLVNHIRKIGWEDEMEKTEDFDWKYATATSSEAWSNLGDIDWDAYIVEVPEVCQPENSEG